MANPDSDTPNAIAPWETKRGPSGKNLFKRVAPWTGVIFLAALLAWGLWPKPVIVETGVAARGALTVRVSEEGKTRVRNRYVVAAPAVGKMQRVRLKPGDEVKAGETVLTVIEPAVAPLLDPRARAQAAAAVSMQEASRKRAEESLEAARAAAKMAAAELERVRSVTRVGTLSESDRERAAMESSMRSAEVRAAEFSLQVIDYELAQARAALDRPESVTTGNLIELKSPVSGRVLRVMQESEMVVTPGVQILEVGDPADIEIEAEILSRDAVAIHPGDSVEIEQWGGTAPLTGRVRRIEPAAFTKISALGVEEQRVYVIADFVDPIERRPTLGDSYRVEARIVIWENATALQAPSGALFNRGGAWRTFVMVGGRAQSRSVKLGRSNGVQSEVSEGLREGEQVIVYPGDKVVEGAAVTPLVVGGR